MMSSLAIYLGGLFTMTIIVCLAMSADGAESKKTTCGYVTAVMAGAMSGSGLVVDLPGCAAAQALAAQCTSCKTVLCATWEVGDSADKLDPEANPNASAADYRSHFSSKVRHMRLGDVPGLRKESADFVVVKHEKRESDVDQKAEIASVFGMVWDLVKSGGVMGVLTNTEEMLVIKDADGGLWLDTGKFEEMLPQTVKEISGERVTAVTCPVKGGVAEKGVYIAKQTLQSESGTGAAPVDELGKCLGHAYVIHTSDKRVYWEDLFLRQWGLSRDFVTFHEYKEGAKSTVAWGSSAECVSKGSSGSEPVLSEKDKWSSGMMYASVQDMQENAFESALLINSVDAQLDMNLPESLCKYMGQAQPDWGMIHLRDTTCSTGQCSEGSEIALQQLWLPSQSIPGAAVWSQRAAQSVIGSFEPCCLSWDKEVDYHLMINNVSVFYVSSPLVKLDPDQTSAPSASYFYVSNTMSNEQASPASRGQRTSAQEGGKTSLDRLSCKDFSFFDCHASNEWDACVKKRDDCGGIAEDMVEELR